VALHPLLEIDGEKDIKTWLTSAGRIALNQNNKGMKDEK
jgi:hypothetical protein